MSIAERKSDHINICWKEDVEGNDVWDDFILIHEALPDVDYDEVDISLTFMGKRLDAPIIISAMTGGTPQAKKLNRDLAYLAQKYGLGFGVGSQRIMIEKPELIDTFYVRDIAPNILLFGNLGLVQFSNGFSPEDAIEAVERIEADSLCIHLNPAHEIVQKDGDRKFRDSINALRDICSAVKFPVVAKETGCGISKETAHLLKRCGVSAIDVGGYGGTSWVGVEFYRAENKLERDVAKTFWHWGIPTPISIVEVYTATGLPIIATGGIRTGVDIVKALSLDAKCVGIALPLLRAYMKEGIDGAEYYIKKILKELRIAMFLTGCRRLEDIKNKDVIITARSREWMEQRELFI